MSSNSLIISSTVSNLLIPHRVFFSFQVWYFSLLEVTFEFFFFFFFCIFHPSSSQHIHVFLYLLKQVEHTYNNSFNDYWSTLSTLWFVIQFLLLFLLFKGPIFLLLYAWKFFIRCWRLRFFSPGSGINCFPLTILGFYSGTQLNYFEVDL